MRRLICALLGHRYGDNGAWVDRHFPGRNPVLAWCTVCYCKLPVRPDSGGRHPRWTTGSEGR